MSGHSSAQNMKAYCNAQSIVHPVPELKYTIACDLDTGAVAWLHVAYYILHHVHYVWSVTPF